jgi:class 3 adenylate cyclase
MRRLRASRVADSATTMPFEIMADLPTGTVTFLFTDIEGSTRLLQALGQKYRAVQEQHAQIMRDAIKEDQGHEIRTEGDSFFVAFRSPVQAVRAAIAAQRGLTDHTRLHGSQLRVRMGLHTGEGEAGGDDYVGIDVNRAARIAAGHGGQVLLSDATRTLVASSLPEGVRVRTLGSYRLKDLPRPERLHQLEIRGLPSVFPPLRALDVRRAHLPPEATTFIGRRAELQTLAGLLAERRLVTLTGPGGSGKSRLALRTAAEVADRFADGAYFVAVASIEDPAFLPGAIASELNLPEDRARPIADVLRDWLGERELLLLLDNLEQIEGAGRVVDDLLTSAPALHVVATSRSPLQISGEQEFPVPPFSVPAEGTDAEVLEASEVVRLFVDRARLVRPGFSPSLDDLAIITPEPDLGPAASGERDAQRPSRVLPRGAPGLPQPGLLGRPRRARRGADPRGRSRAHRDQDRACAPSGWAGAVPRAASASDPPSAAVRPAGRLTGPVPSPCESVRSMARIVSLAQPGDRAPGHGAPDRSGAAPRRPDPAKPPGTGPGPRGQGARGVRRRPHPVPGRPVQEVLCGKRPHHQGLRDQDGGDGPVRPEPSPRGRVLPVGLLGDQQIRWSEALLRPTASPRVLSPSGAPSPVEPARRVPPRMPPSRIGL